MDTGGRSPGRCLRTQLLFLNLTSAVPISTAIALPFATGDLVGLNGQPPSGLVVAAASGGTPPNAIDTWTLKLGGLASDPAFGAPQHLSVPFGAEACCVGSATDADALVSPDGRDLLVPGLLPGDTTGSTHWYAVRFSDGSSTEVVPAGGTAPWWSTDSKSIVYVRLSSTSTTLVVHNLATGDESLVRPLPAGFAGDIWHRP